MNTNKLKWKSLGNGSKKIMENSILNFVTFPNWFSENPKKKLVFHSVLSWSRMCWLIQPPPHSCNIQKPRPINRVNNEFSVYLSLLSYQLIFYPGVQHPKAESNCMTVSNLIDFWSCLRIKNIPITSFGFFWKFRIKL